MKLPPLSLYIHVPWCVRKCPYCDFNSHKADDQLPEGAYISALLDDLQQDSHWLQERPIQTVFIGGGTPSLLSAESYQTLFKGLQHQLNFSPDIEITMEANPGTFEAEKFQAYRELGVNRLSIGIQSFDNQQLQRLGRIHSGEQAQAAIAMAKAAGFDNFNLDLMHGLPGQTPVQAQHDLEMALSFQPPHLSWYQLTIEPNTEFYSKPPQLPEEDHLWDIQEAGFSLLEQKGFQHYEISAFCQPGQAARHNLNYWQFGDYLGIGAGAHGKITQPDGQVIRSQKTRLPKDYLNIAKPYLSATHIIPTEDVGLECLMNALRLPNGIAVDDFEQRTGTSLAAVQQPIQQALKLGLLALDDRIAPTEKGQQYLNELLALFLIDS